MRFGRTSALRGADLEVRGGEVHALLGQNGAGKTTLVRVLAGLVAPDAGMLELDGQPVRLRGPAHARALGIGLVHQHAMLVPALSVAENLLLGLETPAWLSRSVVRTRARGVLRRLAPDLDPDRPARELPVAAMQRLELARVLAGGADVLVLDEPTAVLAPREVDALLALLVRLADEGRGIVLISHRLEEITAICDRVSVLRDGRTVATHSLSEVDRAELGRLMVGRELPPRGRPPGAALPEVALELAGLRAPGLGGVDLCVHAGEILAVTGIDGNGQAPLEEVLAGVREPDAGEVRVARPPLVVLAGDRQRAGLALDLTAEENLVLPDARTGEAPPVFRRGWLSRRALRRAAEAAFGRLELVGRPADPARTLSGGNQQKLCVARALRLEPGVLVAVNPTRGLDVAAASEVRGMLRERTASGTAVLLVSTDLDEVLELGDRIAVLFRGQLLPVEAEARTREGIGERMLGQGAA